MLYGTAISQSDCRKAGPYQLSSNKKIKTLCIYSLYPHYMFTIYSHYMFTIYSLYTHYMFTVYSLYTHYVFTIYSLYVH